MDVEMSPSSASGPAAPLMIRLKTNDGKQFALNELDISCSIALRRMIEGSRQTISNGHTELIQLTAIKSHCLAEILHWTRNHCQQQAAGQHEQPPPPCHSSSAASMSNHAVATRLADQEDLRFACNKALSSELTDWDRAYLDKLKEANLLELIHAANFLDVRCLLTACAQTLAKRWEGMRVEEIRRRYHIEGDFSKDEEHLMIQENKKLGITHLFCLDQTMPRVDNWDEFTERARALYESDPVNCRLTMKYRHNDGALKLKVTDNKKLYQYLVEQPKEIKNIDKFLGIFIRATTQ